jgi:hypothetical protein
MSHFLSPLRGLVVFSLGVPRLTPWAAFFRRFAASIDFSFAASIHFPFAASIDFPFAALIDFPKWEFSGFICCLASFWGSGGISI